MAKAKAAAPVKRAVPNKEEKPVHRPSPQQIRELGTSYKQLWREAVQEAGGDPDEQQDYFKVPKEVASKLSDWYQREMLMLYRVEATGSVVSGSRPRASAPKPERQPGMCPAGLHDMRSIMEDGKSVQYVSPGGKIQCRICKRERRLKRLRRQAEGDAG